MIEIWNRLANMRTSIETDRAWRNSALVLLNLYFRGKNAPLGCSNLGVLRFKVPEFRNRGRVAAFFVLLALATLPSAVSAQVQLIPHLKAQWFDQNGRPLANGCLFTYQSGTTTPQTSFTDSTGGTPNPNPVILNGAGRPPLDVWLTGTTAYRIKLVSAGGVNCASGNTQWQEDGINPSPASLLASNNTWTGSNTFNGAVIFNTQPTFNVGLTSGGPNTLAGGGTLSGTWSGSPIFSGTPNFSNGFLATTGTFSGQITSTVAIGTSPFVITSSTLVANLNAALLNGCTFAIPCPIGSTTPNTGVFTTLQANTSLVINGSTAQTGVQGTDTKLLSAGTFTGATGTSVCKDANGGATTVGCAASFTQIQGVKKVGGLCTNAAGSNNACTDVLTWPVAFADAAYIVACTGVDPNSFIGQSTTNEDPTLTINSYTATTVTVINQNQRGGVAATFTEVHCIGIHP